MLQTMTIRNSSLRQPSVLRCTFIQVRRKHLENQTTFPSNTSGRKIRTIWTATKVGAAAWCHATTETTVTTETAEIKTVIFLEYIVLQTWFEFFGVSTKITDLTFLPLLQIGTDASILSYVKMMSYAKEMIPDICGQHLNNSELHKY